MKKIKNPTSPILVIAVCVAIVSGYLVYSNNLEKSQSEQKSAPVEQVKSDFSFKSVSKEFPDKEVFVEIYKKDELVQTVLVGDEKDRADAFTISPDGKNVAFKVLTIGGTCVAVQSPMTIDLTTFKVKNLTESPYIARAKWPSSIVHIENIKWISENQFQATMKFGEKTLPDCGESTEVAVTYTLAK
jgi:hypothetical protein